MTTEAMDCADGALYLGDNKVAECISLALIIDNKEINASNLDSNNWDEIIGGRCSWHVDGEFNFIFGDTTGFIELQTAVLAGNIVFTVKAKLSDGGYYWTGDVLVTVSDLFLVDVDKQQTVSWTLNGTGTIVLATALLDFSDPTDSQYIIVC
jgi:hypothetical protein